MKDIADYPYPQTEVDEEFVERRVFLKQKIQFPGQRTDYEPYDYDTSHLDEKFRVGIHHEELKKVATKIKEKTRFDNDTNPWKQPF